MPKGQYRGRLWVDPGFQLRLLARAATYMVLYTLVILHVGFLFELTWEVYHGGATSSAFYFEFMSRHRFFLLGAALLLPAILYDLLKFSHRVAGPLYRCRAVMTQMAQGEKVQEFKPRKHDLMSELFLAFNNLIKAWNSRLAAEEAVQRPESHTLAVATDKPAPLVEEGELVESHAVG